jgi:hypothetical protein
MTGTTDSIRQTPRFGGIDDEMVRSGGIRDGILQGGWPV